ncbi:substrate-binding domain-containing protein [Aliarcobacter thereius]|uniref:substrate-binding domain-containing protein n=1 Tax=Aliarcobacter thereius TaxID=544718 RepID=UPI0008256A54|nr:substrate-binding domain-containing protein [Aliarcobacter thereius]OCL93865.1 D-ribose-binding periplasmic protein precursor [Aliarcobacter thereius]
MNKNSLSKIILLLLVGLCFLEAKTYKIGFAQDTLANDWRKAQAEQLIYYSKKYDFLEVTVTDAKGSVANQIASIEKFIKDDYDFIVTSPISPSITSKVLKKAIDKGIKVILLSRGINEENYTSFIAPDNYKIAQEAAKYLLKKINYKGTILMLQGLDKVSSTTLREEGFEDITNKYKDIKIIKVRANYLRYDAIKAMDEIYDKNIHFDAIYSQSDSMAAGARVVIDKRDNRRDIPIIGIDYISEAKDAILNGKQLASFIYPTCAKKGIEIIVSLIEGKEVPKNLIIDTIMVDKDNVKFQKPIF